MFLSKHFFVFYFFLVTELLNGQPDRWQLRVNYLMNISLDDKIHMISGDQELTIFNTSPDTLKKLYYHLYFNAFQPGSDMDIRSRTIIDPDKRIGGRIATLKAEEMGYHQINRIAQKGKSLNFKVEGTIMEVTLIEPIMPSDSEKIVINFEAQVPVQIRRTGRNNKEGVDYSMAQWYPKLCNYDLHGWHTPPYIAREFYGPWGDFTVNIKLDEKYCIAATGYLQNSKECVWPLDSQNRSGKKRVWQFYAPMVHDFVWAADPDYIHDIYTRKDGKQLHFYYLKDNPYIKSWKDLPAIMDTALDYAQKHFGEYPYLSYSFIQGGDGGMEYPLATLITGNRPLHSLVGVCLHEWMHSWYQMLLASNESLYPWMDEGFTSYAEDLISNYIKSKGLLPGFKAEEQSFQETMKGYREFVASGREEALSTHADHYTTNLAYGMGSYTKGALCLLQLRYIMGEQTFNNALQIYYSTWRFKHPNADDFFRTMEKVSGLELDWFKEYWVFTTKTIDYVIDGIESEGRSSKLILMRKDLFPMPVDLEIKLKNGKSIFYTIPLDLMRGNKDLLDIKWEVAKPWHWVNPIYELSLDIPKSKILSVVLDPFHQLADIHPENQIYNSEPE